jgi:hypothetical protein
MHQDIERLVSAQTELTSNLKHPELRAGLQRIKEAAARLAKPDSGLDGPDAQVGVLAETAAAQLQKALDEMTALSTLEHYSSRLRLRDVSS